MEIVAVESGDKVGAEARRGGDAVARLLASLGETQSHGRHAWVGRGDHELGPREAPELLADVYAAAAAPWVESGYLTHVVEVPAEGPLPQLFFELGFGREQVHASSPVRPEPPSPPAGATIRRARPGDIELLLDVAGTIAEHQAGPPVWSGLPVPTREDMRDGWTELLADGTAVVLLAEREGTTVGYAAFYPAEQPGAAHLPVAGTRPDLRGAGLGVALVERALHEAHLAGFDSVELDWRSANLLASRFWPKRGFRPTHLRLRRDVRPPA